MRRAQRGHEHQRPADAARRSAPGWPADPPRRTRGTCRHASVRSSTECRKLRIITGLKTFSSKLPCEPAIVDGGVVAEHLHAHHGHGLGLRRVHLARHDRRAGLVLGQDQLAEAAARARAQPADVVGDLHEGRRQRRERAGREHEGVVRGERGELVRRRHERQAGELGDLRRGASANPGGRVEPGADGGAADRQLVAARGASSSMRSRSASSWAT